MIDGKTRVCGIIADPVEHSMSPAMQNFYAKETNNNMVYVPFRVLGTSVGEAVKGAYALNLSGLNVTVPHKQAVIPYLAEIDEAARSIGAVNTLVRMEEQGGFRGYNTDAAGLSRAMKEHGISVKGQSCILIGAGGAAKAAAYVLVQEGADRIYLLNRSQERARILADDINALAGRETVELKGLGAWNQLPDQSYVAVQATSVGMYPGLEETPIIDPGFYRMLSAAVDVIYTPMQTRFLKLAADAGAATMNGLDMLLYQGMIAYELWNPQIRISQETTDRARALLQKLLTQA